MQIGMRKRRWLVRRRPAWLAANSAEFFAGKTVCAPANPAASNSPTKIFFSLARLAHRLRCNSFGTGETSDLPPSSPSLASRLARSIFEHRFRLSSGPTVAGRQGRLLPLQEAGFFRFLGRPKHENTESTEGRQRMRCEMSRVLSESLRLKRIGVEFDPSSPRLVLPRFASRLRAE